MDFDDLIAAQKAYQTTTPSAAEHLIVRAILALLHTQDRGDESAPLPFRGKPASLLETHDDLSQGHTSGPIAQLSVELCDNFCRPVAENAFLSHRGHTHDRASN